jgi:hypothetical protein
MNVSEIKPGDRVDFRAHRNCEVLKVGRATVWLSCRTARGGALPLTAHPADIRPHVEHHAIRIGRYLLRDVADGKVWVTSSETGETMQTDIAKVESWLAKFWAREF